MSLIFIKNLESQNYTKYIGVIYYYIQELVDDEELRIKEIQKSFMLANRLIKILLVELFKKY